MMYGCTILLSHATMPCGILSQTDIVGHLVVSQQICIIAAQFITGSRKAD